jgi:diaminopimelate decarboxylase
VTLNVVLLSVFAGVSVRPEAAGCRPVTLRTAASRSPESHDWTRRYRVYRSVFPDAEIACPSAALMDPDLLHWVRKQGVAVHVGAGRELGHTVFSGIDPARIVVQGDVLCDSEMQFAAKVGVGRVIIGSVSRADLLARCAADRTQSVLVRTTRHDDAPSRHAADHTIKTVLRHRGLRLEGLHGWVGTQSGAFVSCPAAIGQMIAEMADINRHHGSLLTRLSLQREVPLTCSARELRELATQIDDALDDACAAMRFPRPRVLLSIGRASELAG